MSAGADPFADAAPAGVNDDPFAEVDAIEPTAPAADDLPIVDREGQPAAPAADPADPAAPQAPVVEVNEETGGESPLPPQEAQAPQPSAADTGELAAPADHMAGEPQEAPQEPPAAPEQPAAPAAAPEPPQEPQAAPQPPAEAAAAPAAPAEPEAPAAPAADPPAETPPANGKGKGEMRHYKAFYQTGPQVWTEFPLTGDLPEGVKVVKVEDELYFEARNNDHATRISFALLGQPAEGVTVWPVPKGAFKPKRVKPAAPKPERTRLEIS